MGAARPNGFISSHRVLKTGTHTGFWTYGPPTGRDWISRTVAHCLVQDNKIVEEWLVRDEFAVLEHLGLDPYKVAADLAGASPVTGESLAPGADTGAFAGRIADPVTSGVSGPRPPAHAEACAMVAEMFETVWNRRRFDLAHRFCHEGVVCHTVRMRRVQSLDAYKVEIINLLASFPDAKVELRDIAVNDSVDLGLRVATIWALRGTYCGVPTYGRLRARRSTSSAQPISSCATGGSCASSAFTTKWRRSRRSSAGARPPSWTDPHARRKPDRSTVLSPVVTHSATASPSPAECLKPWPEQADTAAMRSWPGRRSTMKRESGVTV